MNEQPSQGQKVVAYVPDLMDRSKLGGTAADVRFVRSPADIGDAVVEHGADLVIVDLNRDGALDAATKLTGCRVVGFASHIDRDRIAEAKEAGLDETMPRSRFFSQVNQILAGER